MWYRTVGIIVTLTLSILAAPLVADAQPAGKVYRIGMLERDPPYSTLPILMRSDKGYWSWGTRRDRTSRSCTDPRTAMMIGSQTWRVSWVACGWI